MISMPKKATAQAPSNLALVKYMGRKDDVLRLPAHGSVSMNLDGCITTTTVEFGDFPEDTLTIDGHALTHEGKRAFSHLDRIRKMFGAREKAKIVSINTFPRSTGLSSSSSGFAALTVAAVEALGEKLSERELSVLARQGSGSACRSIPSGFVEWNDGETSDESYAESIFPPDHWDLRDIVAVITNVPKLVPSSDTHEAVRRSTLYQPRVSRMRDRIGACKLFLKDRDLQALGPLIERETEDLHALYESIGIVQRSEHAKWLCSTAATWRKDVQVYYSLNTGQNVHLICEGKDAAEVKRRLLTIDCVHSVIENRPARGAHIVKEHLF